MTYNVFSGTLNSTHSLTHSLPKQAAVADGQRKDEACG